MQRLTTTLLLLICLLPGYAAASNLIKVGVLAKRGLEAAHNKWDATADYLSVRVPGYTFKIVPLTFEQVRPAVANREIDYILTNPSMYVELEINYDVSRIATLKNNINGNSSSSFGGVIFTRNSHPIIKKLDDIPGQTFMAVNEDSLGGFHAAWLEFLQAGIDPYSDFADLSFGQTHDAVVMAVRSGKVDAGTVRTDTLERMALEGLISLSDFRIIEKQYDPDYPFVISTQRYPEWPFGKLAHTSTDLTDQVASVLISMPANSAAAVSGRNLGWTVPLNYRPAHKLLEELEIGPYAHLREIRPELLIEKYWGWILGILITFTLLTLAIIHSVLTNRKLQQSRSKLVEIQQNLELRIRDRTEELQAAMKEAQLSKDENEALLNSTLEGIYGMDSTGHTTFINKAAQDMLGYTLEDFQNNDTHTLIHHSHADGSHFPKEECRIGISVREGIAQHIDDEVFWAKDGRAIPVEYTSAPLFKDGEMTGVVVSFRDISERIKSQEAMAQFRSAMEASSDAIYLIDVESMQFIDMNNQACASIGFSRKELLQMGPHDLKPEYSREKLKNIFKEVLESPDGTGEIITQHQRKDDSTFPVEVRLSHMKQHSNHNIVVATARDISNRIESEKILRDSEARWRSLAESSSDYIITITSDMIIDYINHDPPMMTAEEAIGRDIREFIYPEEQREQIVGRLRSSFYSAQPTSFETYLPSADGRPVSFDIQVTARQLDDKVTGLTLYARDITERKHIEDTLRLASVAMESSEAMMITNEHGDILKINHAFLGISGYSEKELIGQKAGILRSERHPRAFYEGIHSTLKKDGSWEGEIWIQRKDEDTFPCRVTITAIKDAQGRTEYYVGNFIDITHQKTAEMRILHQAFYDALTDLPNRRLLTDRLQQTLARCIRHKHTGALLFLDLDGFKPINDKLGHQTGDVLLEQFARRLKLALRDEDTAARLGGDEFVVLLPELQENYSASEEQAIEVAEKILHLTRSPFQIDEHELHITTSIGITLFPGTATTIDDIINQADIAMYEAKRLGKNTHSVYTRD
jgi:two-component system sensor histidine kinase TtrS